MKIGPLRRLWFRLRPSIDFPPFEEAINRDLKWRPRCLTEGVYLTFRIEPRDPTSNGQCRAVAWMDTSQFGFARPAKPEEVWWWKWDADRTTVWRYAADTYRDALQAAYWNLYGLLVKQEQTAALRQRALDSPGGEYLAALRLEQAARPDIDFRSNIPS